MSQEEAETGRGLSPLPKILILGVGNLLLKDDGFGVHAVREIEKSALPENVHLLEAGTVSHQFLPLFNESDYLLVVDAVDAGDTPGSIYKFSPEDVTYSKEQKLSLHQMSLLDVLGMASLTGRVPKTLIFGVQPEDVSSWSLELSDAVRGAIPKIKELIFAELKKINEK